MFRIQNMQTLGVTCVLSIVCTIKEHEDFKLNSLKMYIRVSLIAYVGGSYVDMVVSSMMFSDIIC